MTEIELLLKAFGLTFTFGFGVFVWYAKTWLEANVTKPQEQVNKRLDGIERKVEEVCKKVEKISQVQDGRKGVLTPIEVMVEQTHDMVSHIADVQDAQFQLDGQARFECDSNGYLKNANLAFQEIIGKSIDHLLGNQWMRVIRSEQQDKFLLSWERLTKNGVPLKELVYTEKGKIQITAIKKPDADKQIKLIMGAVKVVQ